jgi:hypothetical protein
MSGTTRKDSISLGEIAEILDKIEPVLKDYPRGHIIIAGLTLAIINQDPLISQPDLHDIVLGVSQFICSALDLINLVPTEELPKEMLN